VSPSTSLLRHLKKKLKILLVICPDGKGLELLIEESEVNASQGVTNQKEVQLLASFFPRLARLS
jgi:hypothetical protein